MSITALHDVADFPHLRSSGTSLPTTVVLPSRLFLQDLCQSHTSWDEPLPVEQYHEWIQLSNYRRFQPSGYHDDWTSSTNLLHQLHTFCDASSKAYATTVYLRCTQHDATATTLIFAKMRLAPTKSPSSSGKKASQVTIPRMELLGALIGVRVSTFVARQLQLPIAKTTIWLDSQCVLHWLSSSNTLKVRGKPFKRNTQLSRKLSLHPIATLILQQEDARYPKYKLRLSGGTGQRG